MAIEKGKNLRIRVIDEKNGGVVQSQSVEANILFAILEKLEEIRVGVINVEIAVEKEKL